ncbi:L-type lectin-domain containing receptor [Vigna angularis]|uniref:L-type lectin-domain containing receptor n=1 Tax=Phaseolus angularis TaxID=3914 RepID=A0A8T0K8Y8_PHAAN|nr:L-type lectin-domain containing receptor [Vigna angularis]
MKRGILFRGDAHGNAVILELLRYKFRDFTVALTKLAMASSYGGVRVCVGGGDEHHWHYEGGDGKNNQTGSQAHYSDISIFANPLSFRHQGFEYNDIKIEGDAILSESEIQLTKTTRYQSNAYSVGRVTSFERLHLWDNITGKLTDFTTQFSFVIFSNETSFGDGLAFFLADPGLPLSNQIQQGGGLGLLDGNQLLNSAKHPFVAVEFDTFQNSWDPPGTHVGINFNSMKSNKTVPWSLDIRQMKACYCVIEYNATTHILNVSFSGNNLNDKPIKRYISCNVDLRYYLPEWVIFGFSAATGVMFELNTVLSWSFHSTLQSNQNLSNKIPPIAVSPSPNPSPSPFSTDTISPKQEGNKGLLMGLEVGVGIAATFLIVGLVCVLMWKRRARGKREDSILDLSMDDEFQKGIGPKRFCYKELASATRNFAESQKIGQGGFGGQITIFEWAWELHQLGKLLEVVDKKLGGAFDEEQMKRLVIVGLWCANPDHTSRPSVRQLIQVLKFEAHLPVLQQKLSEPYYHSPTMSTIFASISSPLSGYMVEPNTM